MLSARQPIGNTTRASAVLPLEELRERNFFRGEIWRGGWLRSESGGLSDGQGHYAIMRVRTTDTTPALGDEMVGKIAEQFQLRIAKRPSEKDQEWILTSVCGNSLAVSISLEHNITNFYAVEVNLTTGGMGVVERCAVKMAVEVFNRKESELPNDEIRRDFLDAIAMSDLWSPEYAVKNGSLCPRN
jgi:hypothetical protein